MKIQCAGCRLFTLKDHAPMAAAGYGKCLLDGTKRPRRFLNATFLQHCPTFKPAPAAIADRRVHWLAQQRDARGLDW